MEMTTVAIGKYNTHVIITDNDKNEYKYSIGLHRSNVTVEDCLLDIWQQMYKGAKYEIKEGETKFQAFEQWIKEGAVNAEVSETYQEEISPAVYTLPVEDEEQEFKLDKRVAKVEVEEDKRVVEPVLKSAVIETKTRILYPRTVIEKKTFKSTHPKKLNLVNRIDALDISDELKEIVKELI